MGTGKWDHYHLVALEGGTITWLGGGRLFSGSVYESLLSLLPLVG